MDAIGAVFLMFAPFLLFVAALYVIVGVKIYIDHRHQQQRELVRVQVEGNTENNSQATSEVTNSN